MSDSADEAHEPSLGSNPSQAQNQVQASQQRQVPADADPSPLKPARLNSQAPKSPSPSKPRMRQISAFSDAKPSTTNTPAAPPKPRLTIHKIVLINFKSYAGVVNIGPFHASFSAIVGPNGSGKSNTIDALLFVFGFKASKMRQGKLSELIHNSDQFQDLDFCSVEVHFREIVDLDTPVPPGQPPPFEVVPGTELVVARTAYRNNTSKYTVNSRTSNYKDVTTLLKGKGIDLDHKRFLILQGEVESIALMKPKGATEHEDGLLEYLEDIIGTDRFKEPLEQANKDVEELNDQRTHAMNRVKLVEHEKALLEVRFPSLSTRNLTLVVVVVLTILLSSLSSTAAAEKRSRRLPPRPEPTRHRQLQALPIQPMGCRPGHQRRKAQTSVCRAAFGGGAPETGRHSQRLRRNPSRLQ